MNCKVTHKHKKKVSRVQSLKHLKLTLRETVVTKFLQLACVACRSGSAGWQGCTVAKKLSHHFSRRLSFSQTSWILGKKHGLRNFPQKILLFEFTAKRYPKREGIQKRRICFDFGMAFSFLFVRSKNM